MEKEMELTECMTSLAFGYMLLISFVLGIVAFLVLGLHDEAGIKKGKLPRTICFVLLSFFSVFVSSWKEMKATYTTVLILVICFGWLMILVVIFTPRSTRS